MKFLFENLANHEKEELINALRRDMRLQMCLSLSDSRMAPWHGYNARNVLRIPECLKQGLQ